MSFVILTLLLIQVAAPSKGPDDVADLPPALTHLDKRTHELVIELPRIDVPARGEMAEGMVRSPVYRVDVPINGSIYRYHVELEDADGQALPSDRLHHVGMWDPGHRELFVPISRRVMAAGKETGMPSAPRLLFGMPLKRGQQLVISGMLANPDTTVLRGVGLKVVMGYVPASRPWPFYQVSPWVMDVMFPLGKEGGSKAFDLPPGRSEWSWEGSPVIAGKVVGMGAHLHDCAQRVEGKDVTAGRVLWSTQPVTDSLGRVRSIPVGRFYRWNRIGIRIHPEHRYRVTVVYDNPTGALLPDGGMGAVAGAFVPDRRGAWPRVDTTDAAYHQDLTDILLHMGSGAAHHHH